MNTAFIYLFFFCWIVQNQNHAWKKKKKSAYGETSAAFVGTVFVGAVVIVLVLVLFKFMY